MSVHEIAYCEMMVSKTVGKMAERKTFKFLLNYVVVFIYPFL